MSLIKGNTGSQQSVDHAFGPTAAIPHTDAERAIKQVQSNLEDHVADTTAAHAASAISVTPAGDLGSTNVQAALEELQGDIDASEAVLAAHLADATDAHDASAISVVPSGDLGSTDVQAALQELQSDIDADEAALAAHLADATDAHDASAISLADAGDNYAATDVEGALAEVMDALQAHEADPTAAHAASAISVTPAGNIASTDVQAALQELDAEKAAASHTHSSSDITDFAEAAQDAVGGILSDGGDVDFTYDDATPAISGAVKSDSVSNAKLADMPAWSVKVRNAGTSGDPSDAALADITEEPTPASGDFLLGFAAGGELRKFDVGNLPGGGGGSSLLAVTVFTASGTWTPNANTTLAILRVQGGGGGGGGAAGATNSSSRGAGGGAGGYCERWLTGGWGTSETVTVGSGGSAGPAGENNGGTGGQSSVGTLAVANGGGGGAGAAAQLDNLAIEDGGAGGTASVSGGTSLLNLAVQGAHGGDAMSSDGTSLDNERYGGDGANSRYGAGGKAQNTANAAGNAGQGFGSGGSGGNVVNSTTSRAGGAGAPGLVIIEEYA